MTIDRGLLAGYVVAGVMAEDPETGRFAYTYCELPDELHHYAHMWMLTTMQDMFAAETGLDPRTFEWTFYRPVNRKLFFGDQDGG